MNLSTTILFDPSQGTSNLGDHIIRRAVDREMKGILADQFIVRYGTHTPLATLGAFVRGSRNQVISNCVNANQKFICGTNILKESLFHLNSDWVVGPLSSRLYAGSVLIGAGLSGNPTTKVDAYTKRIYQRILSHEHMHSVRDDRAAEFLDTLGFDVVNTGCPTTWSMAGTKPGAEHWERERSSVVFTLTDYAQDRKNDQRLIAILRERYAAVHFWPQGVGDLAYLSSIDGMQGIGIIGTRLEEYEDFLRSNDCDFIGTRLHGGILAQEYGARSLILAVDNRARDMAATAPINCIERNDFESIENMRLRWSAPSAAVAVEPVRTWKAQFQG